MSGKMVHPIVRSYHTLSNRVQREVNVNRTAGGGGGGLICVSMPPTIEYCYLAAKFTGTTSPMQMCIW